MRLLRIVFLFCLIAIVSCDKDETNQPCETFAEDHLIFGTYYGECIGNCSFLFKIKQCQVFEDDMEYYYNEELKFKPDALSVDEYTIAEEALMKFPDELWNEQDTVFGIPDAYDQGGIFIQRNLNGEIKSWNLDTNEEVLPAYLAEYASILKTIVFELSN
jgi:hypothetical protein